MGRYILKDGEPVEELDDLAWAKWMKGADPSIAMTIVGEATVSTVFLGIDPNVHQGPPLVFETMVFGGPDDQSCERYATKADAVEGHDAIVNRLYKASGD